MSIFKRLFNFSKPSPAPKTSDESEVEKELKEAEEQLELAQQQLKAKEEELKQKKQRASRMKQAEKSLEATYRSLEVADQRREKLEQEIADADIDIEYSAYSALETAKRLRAERMNRKMGLATNPAAPTTPPTTPPTTSTSSTSNPPATTSSSTPTQTTSEFLNQLPLTSFRCKECPDCRHPNSPRATECEICGHKF